MIKILVVDDERHIVNHFAMLLERETKYTFDVIRAYSGVEALEIIRQTYVPVILMDIKMPVKSGFEVADEVTRIWPETRIIFLTSMDCFDCIYEISRFRHASYLLKIEPDEKISARVYECVEEIQKEENDRQRLRKANRKVIVMQHFLDGNILKNLLYGDSVEDIADVFRASRTETLLNFAEPVYLSLMQIEKTFRFQKTSSLKEELDCIESIEMVSDQSFQYSLIEVDMGLYLLIMQPMKEEEDSLIFARLRSLLEKFSDKLYEKTRYYTKNVFFNKKVEWNRILEVYGKLHQFLEQDEKPQFQSILVKYDSNITAEKKNEEDFGNGETREEICRKLENALRGGDFKEYVTWLENIKKADCFRERYRTNLKACTCFMAVAIVLINFIELHGLEKAVSEKITLLRMFQLERYQNWKEAFDYLEKVNAVVFEVVEKNKENKNQRTIRMIKEYVQMNLGKNITLFSISQLVCYNEVYVSRLFKQEEGIGIFEYVTEMRIAYAEKLLASSDMSVQEISMKAGFSTSQYFSTVFRKRQGMTPVEYRSIHKMG